MEPQWRRPEVEDRGTDVSQGVNRRGTRKETSETEDAEVEGSQGKQKTWNPWRRPEAEDRGTEASQGVKRRGTLMETSEAEDCGFEGSQGSQSTWNPYGPDMKGRRGVNRHGTPMGREDRVGGLTGQGRATRRGFTQSLGRRGRSTYRTPMPHPPSPPLRPSLGRRHVLGHHRGGVGLLDPPSFVFRRT